MSGTEPVTRGTTNRNLEADHMVLMSSKHLHCFVHQEPRTLGIVIVMFGCAEVLMGFQLVGEDAYSLYGLYIPFWQGALFLLCGNLSIYTERHPSKKMDQLSGVEGILFICSLCVSGLLIFLCVVARLALKSTNTQLIVQCIPAPAPPMSVTTPH